MLWGSRYPYIHIASTEAIMHIPGADDLEVGLETASEPCTVEEGIIWGTANIVNRSASVGRSIDKMEFNNVTAKCTDIMNLLQTQGPVSRSLLRG